MTSSIDKKGRVQLLAGKNQLVNKLDQIYLEKVIVAPDRWGYFPFLKIYMVFVYMYFFRFQRSFDVILQFY